MAEAITVLLLDADRAYRDYYAQRLYASAIKYDVVQAATGQSGLDIIARQPIDCVVLEIDLPDMSGVEVLAKLIPRPYRPEIAIIVLTRFYNQFLSNLAIQNGAQAAFPKTAESGELLEAAIVEAISKVKCSAHWRVSAKPTVCPQTRTPHFLAQFKRMISGMFGAREDM